MLFHAEKMACDVPREVKCSNCDKTFQNSKEKRIHIKEVHMKQKSARIKSKCELCGENFESKKDLKLHKETNCEKEKEKKIHIKKTYCKKEKKSIICDICGKMVESKAYLKNHKKIIHSEVKDFVCVSCKAVQKELYHHL